METRIKARKPAGKNFFVVDMIDRTKQKRTTKSLGTQDQQLADTIVHDYVRLLARTDLTTDPLNHILELAGFNRKSLELALGAEHAALKRLDEMKSPVIALTEQDLDQVEQTIAEAVEPITSSIKRERIPDELKEVFTGRGLDEAAMIAEFVPGYIRSELMKFLPEKFKMLNERAENFERENTTLKSRLADALEELARLRRKTSEHVKVTLKTAIDDLTNSNWFTRRALQTQNEMLAVLKKLQAALAPDLLLADLRHTQVQHWLDSLRREDGTAYSARSVEKFRAYVRVVLKKLYRSYDLGEDPTAKLDPGTTPHRDRFDIEAIRSPGDLVQMLETLHRVNPYWEAAVATASLAGLRLGELRHLQVADVDLSAELINVRGKRDEQGNVLSGTKTGRRRRTPIERTVLRPIIAAHLARRQDEQANPNATKAQRSPWLFPTTLGEHPYMARTKSLPGTWSHPKAFHDAYDRVVTAAKAVTGERYYWSHGPDEWRHTAATCMGHAGIDADRGSAWLGNSPGVFQRHYARPATGGELWPFKY